MKRLFMATALALVAALALSGCGTDDGTSAGSSGAAEFNDADVTFAQDMIPHHRQAVQMAKMAEDNASTAEVGDLATTIEAAQGPEIDTMTGWLKTWGKPVPTGSGHGMDHEMGSMDMPGMMSDEDMMNLDKADGASFDRMFLTMMIKHHQGAIEMATTEQTDGKNADAMALAKKIETDQTTEIATMERLVKALPAS